MAIFVLVIAAGLAIVLVAPVRIDLELDIASESSKPSVRLRGRWLFVAWRSGTDRPARPERPSRPRSRSRLGGGPKPRQLLAALRARGFLRRIGRLAVEVWRALAPRTADGWVRFGFEDPVSTGVLFGAAQAVAGLAQSGPWTIRLEPEFVGPALVGHARFVWSVRPAAVLWPVGTFLASPATWRAAVAVLRER